MKQLNSQEVLTVFHALGIPKKAICLEPNKVETPFGVKIWAAYLLIDESYPDYLGVLQTLNSAGYVIRYVDGCFKPYLFKRGDK